MCVYMCVYMCVRIWMYVCVHVCIRILFSCQCVWYGVLVGPVLEFRIYNVREDAGFVEVCVVFNGDASNVTSCLSTLNGTAFGG